MSNPPLLPQILTRSVASTLIADLDASDVLECYSLTRTVRLGGFHNATIQKMAIGLRFGGSSHKRPLELTLEYGPKRLGSQLQEESMPMVITDNHLSWDNEGKVYYTTAAISSYPWKSAYFMASLTGAVLEKILEKAALYSSLKPRYQPFAVVVASDETRDGSGTSSTKTVKQVLKSSSSVDFCFQIWSDMVDLGVDLTPILSPPTYVPRLHISGKILKVSGYDKDGLYVPQLAAQFFQSFSMCWRAIATGDYSSYETSMPSIAPATPSPTARITEEPSLLQLPTELPTVVEPTMAPSDQPQQTTTEPSHDASKNHVVAANRTGSDTKSEGSNEVDSSGSLESEHEKGSSNATENDVDSVQDAGSGENNDRRAFVKAESGSREIGHTTRRRSLFQQVYYLSERLLDQSNTVPGKDDSGENDDVFLGELAYHNLTLTPSESPGNLTLSPSMSPIIDTATEAEKAANEAHAAAQEAKNASTHESAERAADAAEHAADAAQKAANAARWEKDVESMLSGDGALVAQALQRCWTDPLYGMATGNSTTVVGYMYLDGNFYFRMDLTPPYFDIVAAQMQIPQALGGSNGSMITPDDFVDWTLAFCIMGFFLVGLFAFLQQFGLRLAFYKRQKFFFDPTQQNRDDDDYDDSFYGMNGLRRVNSNNHSLVYGEGNEHGFSEDVIPLSMGGRRPIVRSSHLLVTNSPGSADRRMLDIEVDGHLELVDVSSPMLSLSRMPPLDDQMAAASPTTQVPPPRFTRDPDLVDMPSLRSRSKVARPVTLNSLESNDSLETE